ncbi:MAG: ABC transporter ATP-binding protein, partial [bacterium]
ALVSVKADQSFRAEIDDMVTLSVPPEVCHLFAAGSGERIGA